ncbi:TKL protein kinase [Phytophthora megakarya]|uniref:TKL protein kinase n=1 Tax=Phytophthora megakarya TaxID=4795 RepID=A0A225WI28_9STRA|nr:TKL protein kinase [Phytophthora megakarya]
MVSRQLPVALICLVYLLVGDFAYGQSAMYKLHTDSSCSSVPTIIGFQESSSSCSAITTCTSVNIEGESLYWDRTCASDEYSTLSASAYGNKPYVVMEIYESGGACNKLLSGAAFLADGSCLVTDNGVSSMKVSLSTDGSATFVMYRGVSCSGTAAKTSTVSKSSITSHSCEDGALKFYSSSTSTSTTTTTTDGSDKSISTTTSQAAPRSFGSSILLTGTISAILAIVLTLC